MNTLPEFDQVLVELLLAVDEYELIPGVHLQPENEIRGHSYKLQ